MSKIEVNTIDSQCGSALQIGCTNTATIGLGKSGDTITIPSGATIVNSGTQTGFGRTGTVDWVTTVKVTGDSPITAVTGEGYFLNTTAGTITINLPAGAAGSIVSMADYAGTWDTNAVTVSANGSEKIGGIAADASLSTERQSVTFVYIDSTQGWVNVQDSTSAVTGNPFMVATVSGACNTLATAPDCADAKIATFVGPGTFCVSQVHPCAANNLVSYMVVAGGGGGGSGCGQSGSGGGAGGFRETKSPVTPYTASPLDGYPTPGNRITVTATGYPITVGAGGDGAEFRPAVPGTTPATSGSTSTFSSIDSAGGGKGSTGGTCYGTAGGSGSGGGQGPFTGTGAYYNGPGCAAAGNTPPVSPSQGFAGGTGYTTYNTPPGNSNIGAGGGGGATAVGGDVTSGIPSANGDGGAGATTSISASPTAYSGGGGGGIHRQGTDAPSTTGGTGGGGAGGRQGDIGSGPTMAAVAGTVNTGGGGGGSGDGSEIPGGVCGGNGGSGIVIIRYKFQ